jgi:RNA polymerase sigma-70 factor (ECF subfamily)
LDHQQPVTLHDLLVHERFVRDLARRLLAEDVHAAEDLTQDVWRTALERPPGHRRGLKAWLRSVVLALHTNRLRKRSPIHDEALEQRARHERTSPEELESNAMHRAVARAVDELREPYREVVILRFYEALPPREVARRLDRPVQTVRTQTRRGLELVRQALQRDRKGDLRALLLPLAGAPAARKLERLTLPAVGLVGAVIAITAWRGFARAEEPPHAAPLALAQATADPDQRPSAATASAPVVDDRAPLPAAPSPEEVATASAPASAARSFHAKVVDAEGRGVAGAALLVRRGRTWVERARTGASGTVEFALDPEDIGGDPLVAESVWIKAQADGRATAREALIDMQGRQRGEVELEVGSSAATLAARLIDRDGIPVPEARVLALPAVVSSGTIEGGTMFRTARQESRTDLDGAFVLEHLAVGPTQVLFEHPDLGIGRAVVDLPEGELATDLRFDPGCVVRGTVRDELGAPVAGARVDFDWRQNFGLPVEWGSVFADGEGRFALSLPGDNSSVLNAFWKDTKDAGACEIVHPQPGIDVTWDPILRRWPPLRVRVVDLEGSPVRDWVVNAYPEDTSWPVHDAQVTDEHGRVALLVPVDALLKVDVVGPRLGRRETALAVLTGLRAAEDREHEIQVDVQRLTGGTLLARLSARGFDPPENLMLTIHQQDAANFLRKPVDPGQELRADGLAPGSYLLLLVGAESLMAELASVEVSPGAVTDLGSVELHPPGRLDLSRLPAERRYALNLKLSGGKLLPCWTGLGGAGEPLLLFPGKYLLEEVEGRAELRFEMPAGGLVEIGSELEQL